MRGPGFQGLGASQQTPEAEMGEPRGALRAAGRQGTRDPAAGEKEWARKVGRGKGEGKSLRFRDTMNQDAEDAGA